MIRLNDKDESRINENTITRYFPRFDDGLEAISMIIDEHYEFLYYSTEEARDKDIELLDKLFEVKSIEDKVEDKVENKIYPNSTDAFNYTISSVNKEAVPVEEYVTWDDISHKGSERVELPNGETAYCKYEPQVNGICFFAIGDKKTNAYIYGEDIFNALQLRRVK